MRKLLTVTMLLSVFLSVLTAVQVTETEDPLTTDIQMSADVPVYMYLSAIDYFEAGFITQPFDGSESPALSDEAVTLTLGNGGYASGSVYVYWVYATSDKVGMNISLSPLESVQNPGAYIDWQVDFGEGETVTPESENVQLVAFNEEADRFLSDSGYELLSIRTSESVDGKPADSYEGTITLEIVSLGQ